MTQHTDRNPFMLMLHPEVVLAAVERSEHLGQLNRHLCRPLDRLAPTGTTGAVPPAAVAAAAANDDEIDREMDGIDCNADAEGQTGASV